MTDQAYLVDRAAAAAFDVLGPVVEGAHPARRPDEAPCLVQGAIPPGGSVPLHSHPEPETFVAQSGTVEGLLRADDWVPVGPGDVVHVPGSAPHAWRNRGDEPAVTLIVTATRIARFFSEVGTPVAPDRRAPDRRCPGRSRSSWRSPTATAIGTPRPSRTPPWGSRWASWPSP